MTLILSLLGFGRLAGRAVFGWLSRRSIGEVGFIILACLSMFLLVRANHWKSVATERQAQLVKCETAKQKLQDTLDGISTRKNEQQVVTKDRIVVQTKIVTRAEKEAQRIESAPSAPGDCHRATPPAIVAEEGF